jgi:hypothetical protein
VPTTRPGDQTYAETVSEAVSHFSESGYTSPEDLEYWNNRIRAAAERELIPQQILNDTLRSVLTSTYKRLIDDGGIFKTAPGVERFTIDRLRPELRAELDKRIVSSAQLIKLNREKAIEDTLRRFSGWATSIPQNGTTQQSNRKTTSEIKKSMRSLPFAERRVLVDQGHKLTAAISDVVAQGGGAIAVKWKSNWRQANYNYRSDHKERDYEWNKSQGRDFIYLLKKSWAFDQGLVKPGTAGFYDNIDQVGQAVFCRCKAIYVFSLRDLPPEMLTKKGAAALDEAKRKVDAMMATA